MQNRKLRMPIVVAAGLLAPLAPAARAHACGGEATTMLAFGAAGLLAPSEIGVAISAAGPSADRLVIGWSWQVPIDAGKLVEYASRHRVVGGVDLLPSSGGVSWRGRLGYRYGRRHAFGGAGVGLAGGAVNLSPELGVKFMHDSESNPGGLDLSLHLLARAEIEPESGHLRGGTILLGWNFL